MWKNILIWFYICGYCAAGPFNGKRNMPIIQREEEPTATAMEIEANKPEAANIASVSDEAGVPPNMPMISTLTLPSNATSIRADITDGFSCANKSYGYYADVENDCQIFHVCLPVTYADGRENTFRWSFICPEDTIFSQDSFTCMRHEDMTIDCEESFKYYELNRNFGVIEDETKTQSSDSAEQHIVTVSNQADQVTSMTQHLEHKEPHKPQRQPQPQPQPILAAQPEQQIKPLQTISDEQVIKPATAFATTMPQKQNPTKLPKPNRRKPITASIHKKKPIRKTASTATTAPHLEIVTLASNIAEVAEIKPTSFRATKRPAFSTNLKEKIQPIGPTDTIPIRIELYNQKRKRPALLNKKEATTIKPIEEEQLKTTELPTVLESATQTLTDAAPIENSENPIENILTQASEASSVFVKPLTIVDNNDSKKIAKPQPTEPEISGNPTINILEEMSTIKPLEAFEEIPAVIAEVEETNANEVHPTVDQRIATNTLPPQLASIEEEHIAAEKLPTNTPAIVQQNSEESTPITISIEEMEDQKPADAPESIIPLPDMEQQHPMIEQMFAESDTEANKQTMGGFKPVDPAEAAEAEALIANFLNTLMKTEQVNASPIVPVVLNEPQIMAEQENLESKPTSQKTDADALSTADTVDQEIAQEQLSTAPESQLPTRNDSLLPSIMMMHNHPGEIFQIPVQVIQTPIEELTQTKPATVDSVVELVKKQLDQNSKPEKDKETGTETETEKTESSLTENTKIETDKNDKIKFQKLGEELILPIYHRISSEPNINMLKAPSENMQKNEATIVDMKKDETEKKQQPTATTEQIKIKAKSKNGRSERARSIKTVSKMDPRKRRFLFRSDVS